jgi:hypothetical protein
MAYQFMYKHQGQYAITKMARELGVGRSAGITHGSSESQVNMRARTGSLWN